MKIKISEIEGSKNIKYKEDDFEFLKGLNEGSSDTVNIDEPIDVNIDVTGKKGRCYLKGSIKGVLGLNCSRCLESYTLPFDKDFSLTLKEVTEEDFLDVHEIELTEDDLRSGEFSNGEVDITSVVQEQIALLCPMKPLCKEDCKGLCPKCGANLNEEDCGCEPDEKASPFAALKDLK
jgi:uncharacterized protein